MSPWWQSPSFLFGAAILTPFVLVVLALLAAEVSYQWKRRRR